MTNPAQRILMLVENFPYPEDPRVRNEAESLANAGYEVTVLAPRAPGQPRSERIGAVGVRRYWLPRVSETVWGYLVEYAVAHTQLFLRAARELVGRADVVHIGNPPDTLFIIGLLARALGRKVLFDQHDSGP